MALDVIRLRHPAIFLSASIPTFDRAPKYFETADIIAIRDCIKALVVEAVPKYALVWGGHPSITPMIRLLIQGSPKDIADYFVLYQSKKFKNVAPKDNEFFRQLIWVDDGYDRESSLKALRQRMLTEPNYVAGVFIGGMEGIETEFNEFHRLNPKALTFPIASTGGAAAIIFREWEKRLALSTELSSEVSYPYLFKRVFSSI